MPLQSDNFPGFLNEAAGYIQAIHSQRQLQRVYGRVDSVSEDLREGKGSRVRYPGWSCELLGRLFTFIDSMKSFINKLQEIIELGQIVGIL